jgi:hypothetical protein
MREIRQSGSEGGGDVTVSPYPYQGASRSSAGIVKAANSEHRSGHDATVAQLRNRSPKKQT